jgi:hypothetical protein
VTFKPAVSPVPKPLWNENLRHRLSKSAWSKLRKQLIDERGLRCETCGKEVAESKKISAHEEWEYDTSTSPAVAHLTGIKLSCWLCHAVEHVGFANELAQSGAFPNALEYAIQHFCAMNNVGRDVYEKHKDEAFAEWHRRNAMQWRVDWGDFTALVK